MQDRRGIDIPSVVRIKPGALDRVGIYLRRAGCGRVALLWSEGLPEPLIARVRKSIAEEKGTSVLETAVAKASFEDTEELFRKMDPGLEAIVGLGGGKALDTAKYVSFLLRKPYFAVPTSLSNDGFCSPQSSLTIAGKRRSLPSAMPFGVIVDTEVCLRAPKVLWLSGVGDLVSKITAVRDWKLAFHHNGTPVDDFAALLSDASVFQFMGGPDFDLEGMRLLATALMLNGISMSICGSSRPASGSEHLISHALDAISARPRLHGLQVGVATYLIGQLNEAGEESIAALFDRIGFWQAIADDPFSRSEWKKAVAMAPSLKANFHTILSVPENVARLEALIERDSRIDACFVD